MVGPQIAQAQSTNSTLNHNLLPDREVVVHRDIPTIRFAATEIESLAKIDRFILVGKFSHGKPKLELIKKHFATQYILRGQVTIGWRDSRHVFLIFSNLQDCTEILLKGQILFNGINPMRLFRWTLDFNTEIKTSLAPVRVLFSGLPIHFFDASALALICKPIGKVLGVDLATLHKSKPHVARVRVEMDLLKPLIHKIFIGTSTEPGKEDEGIYQSIEYECIPFYCTKCFKQGHATEKCKLDVEAGQIAERLRKGKFLALTPHENEGSGFMRQGRRSRSIGKMAYPIPLEVCQISLKSLSKLLQEVYQNSLQLPNNFLQRVCPNLPNRPQKGVNSLLTLSP
ncbi:hypothetical protein DM860_001048 [Cuscuta australis]|uniref:DUF4283 domain-containing protein n=1 Tax=Cuscuta australis TaxID=267555 RepID=A0A328DW58_9ASTE|nr:hypothetical protein DM860_001048 [Cuscuta australis]